MEIHLRGLANVEKQLARIERATKAMGGYVGSVGSRAPYAFGIEEGYHRVSGKLARRAGGAKYLRGAVDQVLSSADADLSAGLTKVSAPGRWIFKRLALWARRLARLDVPRQSGRLRRTIRAEVRSR